MYIHLFKNFLNDEIVIWLYLDKQLHYMEDFVSVSSFVLKNNKYEIFAVYDGHGGIDPKSGLKKEGKFISRVCL